MSESAAASESTAAQEVPSNGESGQVAQNSEERECISKKSKTQGRGRTTGGISSSTRTTRSSIAENSRTTRSTHATASGGTVTRGTKRKAVGNEANTEYAIFISPAVAAAKLNYGLFRGRPSSKRPNIQNQRKTRRGMFRTFVRLIR